MSSKAKVDGPKPVAHVPERSGPAFGPRAPAQSKSGAIEQTRAAIVFKLSHVTGKGDFRQIFRDRVLVWVWERLDQNFKDP